MRYIQRSWFLLSVLSVLWIGCGCVHHETLNVDLVTPLSDPKGAPAVVIVKVTDARKFQADPVDVWAPTVADSKDLSDQRVTSRSIGKAKNGLHTFFYNLPEGQNVGTVVQAATQNALRQKGYSVVANDSPLASSAIPVEVEINKLWSSFTVGFWVVTANSQVEVALKSPIVLNGSVETVSGSSETNSPLMATGMITATVERALEDLIVNAQAKLKKP